MRLKRWASPLFESRPATFPAASCQSLVASGRYDLMEPSI